MKDALVAAENRRQQSLKPLGTTAPLAGAMREEQMVRQAWKMGWCGCLMVAVTVAGLGIGPACAGEELGRAAWLMGRPALEDLALTGQRFEQSEIGGGGAAETVDVPGLEPEGIGMRGALPVLMSLILPGAGEVAMGYKRGYVMAAADIFAWTQVAKNHSDGGELRDKYIAYADKHYSDELLVAGYYPGGAPIDGGYRVGEGDRYFSDVGPINSVDELNNLPLYVTKEEDFREYYENLGKWDQFIFGWDDYRRPDDPPEGVDFTWTGDRAIDLQQPWVSAHREEYRLMRNDSNQAFKKRDRWLYANIGLRLVSVFQVAYLQGMLGGAPARELEVAGHKVEIRATPAGLYRGSLSARVSF
jgi:hypothetical protein